MLVSVLTSLILAAPPTSTVLITRRTNVTNADAQAIQQQIDSLLKTQGVAVSMTPEAAMRQLSKLGVKDVASCTGRKACVAEVGRQLGVAYIFSVAVSQVGTDGSVAVDLIQVQSQSSVEKESFLIPPRASVTQDLLAGFIARVKKRFDAAGGGAEEMPSLDLTADATQPKPGPTPPPSTTTDTPKDVSLTPQAPVEEVDPDGPLSTTTTPVAKSHTLNWVLLGSGVVAIGVGVVLMIVGVGNREQANAGVGVDPITQRVYSAHTRDVAQGYANAAGAQFGIAGVLFAAGLGLGTASLVTW